jgi:hypothetical protein
MQGRYFYGDFCSGRLWTLRRVQNGHVAEFLTQTTFQISTFGEDEQGRLYVADYGRGTIHRIDEQ